MTQATAGGRLLSHADSVFIDGEWTRPSGDATIDVVNPSTEELFLEVPAAQAADVDRAVAAARRAFDHGPWPRLTHAERAGYLRDIARRLDARSADLGLIWTSETGILRAQAQGAGTSAGAAFDYYASLADSFPFEERHTPRSGGAVGLLVREAVGVVGAIIPWNAPLSIITYKIAPALLAGCSVIIKAAPEAPGAAYVLAEICQAIGLPRGVVNVLTADREVSELLVRHPDVDKISFTGSSAAGKRIASICGARIARCTLELGGKSAGVVLDDYDIAKAARSLSFSARLMAGQVCSSLTRIIVTRSRHDELVDAMAAAFSAIKVGDPMDAASEMGPLAMSRQRDRVEHYIARGQAEGARLAAGGGRPGHLSRGFYVEPTLFANVDNDMVIAREEIFGPVVSVIPAENEAQAIELANESAFGLNASIFTDDADKAYRVARQIRSGTVGHNSFRTEFAIAFGGFKQSGIGREGGTEGLLPFLETKTIILNGGPAHLNAPA